MTKESNEAHGGHHGGVQLTGWLVRDVVLTWEEYQGLMDNLLAPEGGAAGETKLSEWLAENGERVGRMYASEVARHYRVPVIAEAKARSISDNYRGPEGPLFHGDRRAGDLPCESRAVVSEQEGGEQ